MPPPLTGRKWPLASGAWTSRAWASGAWADRLAAAAALFGVIILIWAAVTWITHPTGLGYDLRAYYNAALRLADTGSVYQAETLNGPFSPGPFGLYLYAPPLAVLLSPLTLIPIEQASVVWLVARMLLLGLTAALMPVSRRIRLVTFAVAACSAPVLGDLNLGNVSLIVTFAAVVGWRSLDRPLGGVAIGASLMLRPTMGLLGIWWLLRGRWRPVTWSVAAVAILFLASLPFVGLRGWTDYLLVLRSISNVTGVPHNVDLGSALLLLGASESFAQPALLAGYAVAIVAFLFSLRRDRELSYVVTVMATLLLSPLLWNHYLTHLMIPAAFLASRGRPWALALPLVAWLPVELTPFLVLVGLLLPFLAADVGERGGWLLDRIRGRSSSPPVPA